MLMYVKYVLGGMESASMWVSFFSGIVGFWSMRVEGAEAGSRVHTAVDMTEVALWEMTSVRQLHFIPEYSEARTHKVCSVTIKGAMEKQIHEYRTR